MLRNVLRASGSVTLASGALEIGLLLLLLLYAADYFFSLHNYFSFITVSVYVAIIFHLIITKFTLYLLLDYTIYRIVPVYLMQTYKYTSVDAPYTYISFD